MKTGFTNVLRIHATCRALAVSSQCGKMLNKEDLAQICNILFLFKIKPIGIGCFLYFTLFCILSWFLKIHNKQRFWRKWKPFTYFIKLSKSIRTHTKNRTNAAWNLSWFDAAFSFLSVSEISMWSRCLTMDVKRWRVPWNREHKMVPKEHCHL